MIGSKMQQIINLGKIKGKIHINDLHRFYSDSQIKKERMAVLVHQGFFKNPKLVNGFPVWEYDGQ